MINVMPLKRYSILIWAVVLMIGCTTAAPAEPTAPSPTPATLVNPAADYCARRGFRYELRAAADGSQSGVCMLEDGSACDGWRFFNTGDCDPADEPGEALLTNPAADYCRGRGYSYELRTNLDGSQFGVCLFDDGTECDGWTYYNGACVPRTVETLQQMTLGANPAAVYCEEVGHTFELRDEPDGRQSGICLFADGSECNAWAYYNGACVPGTAAPLPAIDAGDGTAVAPVLPGGTLNVALFAGLDATTTVEVWTLDANGGYTLEGTITDATLVSGMVSALAVDLPLQARTRCAPQFLLNFLTPAGDERELGFGCGLNDAPLLRGAQPFWQTQEVQAPESFARLLAIARNTLRATSP